MFTTLQGTLILATAWSLSVTPPPADAETMPPTGAVFVVEGVGGWGVLGRVVQYALPRAGVHHEVHNFVWTHGRGHMFKDLQDIRHILKKGDELAKEVRRYKEEHPDLPVYLIGESGGTGIVLAASEQLPPGTVERIVLLAAAVSPTYDLRPALRASRKGIVAFRSKRDTFVLGWGTSNFGTVDRCYEPSAGLRGFVAPDDLNEDDRDLYDRLEQVAWNPAMILHGHFGNHLGNNMPGFIGKDVAPWLK